MTGSNQHEAIAYLHEKAELVEAALAEYWDTRQTQYVGGVVRHFAADVLVDGDGNEARGSVSSMVVDYRDGSPHIMNTGRMRDELVKQDGTWRFRSRTVIPDGMGGVGGGPFDAKAGRASSARLVPPLQS